MLVDVINSDLSKDPDYLVDYDNVGMYKPRVVLLVFIIPITEFRSRDSISKVNKELDYEKIVWSVGYRTRICR